MKDVIKALLIIVFLAAIYTAVEYYIATSDLPFWMKFALLK